MGPGSLGFDLSYTFFPRRLADRRVLFCKSDKPPCRRPSASLKGPQMMISDLRSATSGSAAADLPLADNVLLSPGGGIYKLKTNVFRPLPEGTSGLILGRSNTALRGLTWGNNSWGKRL